MSMRQLLQKYIFHCVPINNKKYCQWLNGPKALSQLSLLKFFKPINKLENVGQTSA